MSLHDSQAHTTSSPRGQRHDRINPDLRVSPMDADDGQPVAPQEISVVQKMSSALMGSLLTSLLVTPLDVVRIRLQSHRPVQTTHSSALRSSLAARSTNFANLPPNLGVTACCREVFWVNNNASFCVASPNIAIINNPTVGSTAMDCAAQESQRKAFTSTFDGIRKIARNEGLLTLWRGLTPTLIMAVPANVIYFTGYEWLRFNPASPYKRAGVSDNYIPLLAGSSARMLAATSVSPIEMFRTRIQASSTAAPGTSHFRHTLDGLRDMVSEQGIRALYRGLTLTLWRDVPFSAIYWWGYEYGRNKMTVVRDAAMSLTHREFMLRAERPRSHVRNTQALSETLFDSFAAGAGSGAVAALVTTPFDVGKTRQQVFRHGGGRAGKKAAGAAVVPEELSMPRFLWHIFQEQGLAGLFRGWTPRVLKVAPACAIMISSYEIGKKMAGGINERRDARRDGDEAARA